MFTQSHKTDFQNFSWTFERYNTDTKNSFPCEQNAFDINEYLKWVTNRMSRECKLCFSTGKAIQKYANLLVCYNDPTGTKMKK